MRCAVQYQQPKLSAESRVDLFGGNRRRATADVTRHVKCLEPRPRALGEKLDVAFGEIVRHSALAERSDHRLAFGTALLLSKLVENLVRGSRVYAAAMITSASSALRKFSF